ncbi:hypothetical protein [Kitasatospora sp. NPDC087314]|uniref:hypothetical protein n=1 Tax=Kitasatospora sp. NPDC087314 TaxID=3364068 RepID=UPI00380DA40F
MSPIIPYTFPETATAVRESIVNAPLDAALSRLASPSLPRCPDLGSDYDELNYLILDHLFGPLPELPAWSPQTELLVAEFEARTGGAR